LNRVHKSELSLILKKTNGSIYLLKADNATLAAAFTPILEDKNIKIDIVELTKIVSLIKDRANFVSDFLGN
jgi:glutamyl-tRNA synthetase